LKNGSANTPFPLVDLFSGIAHNSFEMQQATAQYFSNENCANPGKVTTNRKKGITINKKVVHTHRLFKNNCSNSKAFGVKLLRI
jgi:hypothetical protein